MSLEDTLDKPLLPEGFEFIKKLGSGAQGNVYLVNHPEIYGKCAMKILGREELLAEARTLYHLWTSLEPNERKNPYLATLLNINLDSIPPHILIEYVDGENYLESQLNSAERVRSRFLEKLQYEKSEEKIKSLKEAIEMISKWLSYQRFGPEDPKLVFSRLRKLANALAFIHSKGRVHGDIKSSNIIINDEYGIFKLIDFGVSGVVGKTSTSYGAPEVLLGGYPTHTSDVYAFGCFAYRAYTGILPFLNDEEMRDWENLDTEGKRKAKEQILERKLIGRTRLKNTSLYKAAGRKMGNLILRCIEKSPAKRPLDGIALHKIMEREHIKRVVFGKKAIAAYLFTVLTSQAIYPYVERKNMTLVASASVGNERDIVMSISDRDFTLKIADTEKDEFNPRWVKDGILYRRENELMFFSLDNLRSRVVLKDFEKEDYFFVSEDKSSLIYTMTKDGKTSLYFAFLLKSGFLKGIKLIDGEIKKQMGISCYRKYVFFTKEDGLYVATGDGSSVDIFPKRSEEKTGLKKIAYDDSYGFAMYDPNSQSTRLGFVDTGRHLAVRADKDGKIFHGNEVIDEEFIEEYKHIFLERNSDNETRFVSEFITPWPEYVLKILKKTSGLY